MTTSIASINTISAGQISAMTARMIPDYRDTKQIVKYTNYISSSTAEIKTLTSNKSFNLSYQLRLKFLQEVEKNCHRHRKNKRCVPESLRSNIRDTENKIRRASEDYYKTYKKSEKLFGTDEFLKQLYKDPHVSDFFKVLNDDKERSVKYFNFAGSAGEGFVALLERFKYKYKICRNSGMPLRVLREEMSKQGYDIDYKNKQVRTNLALYDYGNISVFTAPTSDGKLIQEVNAIICPNRELRKGIDDVLALLKGKYPCHAVTFVHDIRTPAPGESGEKPACIFQFVEIAMRSRSFNITANEINNDRKMTLTLEEQEKAHKFIRERDEVNNDIRLLEKEIDSYGKFYDSLSEVTVNQTKLASARKKREILVADFASLLEKGYKRPKSRV